MTADLTRRLDDMDRRLAALEGARSVAPAQAAPEDSDPFWALNALKERAPAPGAVVYAGAVTVAAGPVDWQITAPTDDLIGDDWTRFAAALSALGHPVRLEIVQAVLAGATTVAELSGPEGHGSTGQLYHHLAQLTAQGWLVSVGRGRYGVPPERIVPLLAIIAAVRR